MSSLPRLDFPTCFSILIDPDHEDGYVNNPSDPGGETKYGCCKRTFPTEDIANLTEARARVLHERDYWGPAGCSALPDPINFLQYDLAINSGVPKAIKILQRSVEEREDGILGPLTLQAVSAAPLAPLVLRLIAHRQLFQANLENWPSAGKGWARRNANNMLFVSRYLFPVRVPFSTRMT